MRDITPEFSFIEDYKTQLQDIEKRMYREKMNALKELVEKLYKENSDCGMHHNQNVVQIIKMSQYYSFPLIPSRLSDILEQQCTCEECGKRVDIVHKTPTLYMCDRCYGM